jgi:hypothetical protein
VDTSTLFLESTVSEYETEYESGFGAIAKALAAAQSEMRNPAFDSSNPHFRSSFASLASVRNAVVPVLSRHGIAMTQDVQTTEKGVACFTTLWHESGQRLTFGPLTMPATKADAQGFGSAATAARRYALMAVAGVVGDEDDDANAASGKATKEPVTPRPDTSDVDPPAVAKYVQRAADIHAQDLDDAGIDAAVFALHQELAPQHDLYVAVMDALVERKLFTQAGWKSAIKNHHLRQPK